MYMYSTHDFEAQISSKLSGACEMPVARRLWSGEVMYRSASVSIAHLFTSAPLDPSVAIHVR